MHLLPKYIHLVGIGGEGMQALAHYLLDTGRFVSGSDRYHAPSLDTLKLKGAVISLSGDSRLIKKAQLVILSNAISKNHPEVVEAHILGLPILSRAQALSQLSQEKESIFIAGSHGKSTTTAMLMNIANLHDPNTSYLIGASLTSSATPRGRWVEGKWLIAEACEAFGNIEWLSPNNLLLTNIDDDHLEHYGNQQRLDAAFSRLLNKASKNKSIVCGDDYGLQRILPALTNKPITFGFNSNNDARITQWEPTKMGSRFILQYLEHSLFINLLIPGRHNALNAAGAALMALNLKIPAQTISKAISEFSGIKQRWQDYGLIGDIHIVEDFAHHPTALQALIQTAREQANKQARLVIAYQPQLYSRTHRLHEETIKVLSQCDAVLLLEIDPQGEIQAFNSNSDGSHGIVKDLNALGTEAHYFSSTQELEINISSYIRPHDYLIITGGVGMQGVAPSLYKALQNSEKGDAKCIDNFFKIENTTHSCYLPKKLHQARSGLTFLWRRIHRKNFSALELFERNVRYFPRKTAISDKQYLITYEQLNQLAAEFAHTLADKGIRADQTVGVFLYSSIELIVSMLALAKLGATYLPLDTSLPKKRLMNMLTQAGSNTVICMSENSQWGQDSEHNIIQIGLKNLIQDTFSELEDRAGVAAINPSSPYLEIESQRNTTHARLNAISYICFTSGSTGMPKGVPITWANLSAFINQLIPIIKVSKQSKVLINTAIGFDISLGEIWMSLCSGAQLVTTQSNKPLIGTRLSQILEQRNITHLCITPSLMHTVPKHRFSDLNCIISVGEACHQDLVDEWAGNYNFFNAYGPTEATIYATIERCFPKIPVTIGKPLAHMRTYILDEQLQPTKPGEIGELYLGGKGVSSGYLHGEPPATPSFFQLNLANKQKNDWVYRTGDLVKQNTDGKLVYLGRKDRQVKINGVRIELGEIERWIRKIPGIFNAAVISHIQYDQQELIAFVLLRNNETINQDKIIHSLREILPEASIPKRILFLSSLPLSPNGKIDYTELEKSAKNHAFVRPFFSEPRTATEQAVVVIWKKILGINIVGVYDDFYLSGGDSLKSLELIDVIENEFSISIPPGYLGVLTHIATLAVQIEEMVDHQINSDSKKKVDKNNFYMSRIYQRQKHLLSTWKNHVPSNPFLMVSLGSTKAKINIFSFIQNEDELINLQNIMGDDFQVHGLRSGHLIMTYTNENIEKLTKHYLCELEPLLDKKPFMILGVCQGGLLAAPIASELLANRKSPILLALVEQSRLSNYPNSIAFFYSKGSYLNPITRFGDYQTRYREIYHDKFTIDLIEGAHGSIFVAEHGQQFARQLKNRIHNLLNN